MASSQDISQSAQAENLRMQGMVASVVQNRMVCLNSAAGSNKLDTASSLDIPAATVGLSYQL